MAHNNFLKLISCYLVSTINIRVLEFKPKHRVQTRFSFAIQEEGKQRSLFCLMLQVRQQNTSEVMCCVRTETEKLFQMELLCNSNLRNDLLSAQIWIQGEKQQSLGNLFMCPFPYLMVVNNTRSQFYWWHAMGFLCLCRQQVCLGLSRHKSTS